MLRSSGIQDTALCSQYPRLESRSRQFSSNGFFGRYHADIFLDRNRGSRERLVVRTLRCGRSNPGSNPGHDSNFFFIAFSVSWNFSKLIMGKLRCSGVQDSLFSDATIV